MVPGLDVNHFGTRTSITLQGMDAKYVLFLVDGERIAGEVNGDIDYSMLNMENIDRIEVVKGASSSLYGSNAIGGVINIITKRITESFDGKFYSRYSKYNELVSGGGISLKKGIIGWPAPEVLNPNFSISCRKKMTFLSRRSRNSFVSLRMSRTFRVA